MVGGVLLRPFLVCYQARDVSNNFNDVSTDPISFRSFEYEALAKKKTRIEILNCFDFKSIVRDNGESGVPKFLSFDNGFLETN